MADLYVIEAPGKVRQLEALLKGIGVDARVQATKGHILGMPDKLTPLGVDSAFREYERKPRDPVVVEWLRRMASEADRVVVATDADQEGDVIAWDVAELIRDLHPEPVRVRLKGMDEASVREAIDAAVPVSKRDAVAGRTRATVDRMIGAVFSHDGIAVGRVGTAILGMVSADKPVTGRLTLVAPAKDGGRPWTAECEVRSPMTRVVADRLAALDLPAMDLKASTRPATTAPSNMGDVMVRAGDRLDMSPKEAEKSLQRLYEAGRMSYPRANSRGISRGVLNKVAKVLKNAGYKFEDAAVADKSTTDVHDAPYPIGKVEVQRDPVKMGHDEGVRTMVARDLVKTGQRHVVEVAATAKLAEHLRAKGFDKVVVDLVCALHWKREQGPRYPGQETWPESAVTDRRPDTVLLEQSVKRGLGRPSTWANHVETFMGRGLVDERLDLTDKGRSWIAGSPPALLDPRVSAAIENACEKVSDRMMDDPGREPWEILAERIVQALPEQIRGPLVASVASERPRPKADLLAPYAETVGLDEALAARRVRTFAPPAG